VSLNTNGPFGNVFLSQSLGAYRWHKTQQNQDDRIHKIPRLTKKYKQNAKTKKETQLLHLWTAMIRQNAGSFDFVLQSMVVHARNFPENPVHRTNYNSHLTAFCPRVGTIHVSQYQKVKTSSDFTYLKQETVSGSTSLHLAPDRYPRQHPTTQLLTGRMPFHRTC